MEDIQVVEAELTRLVYHGFIDGSISLAKEEGIYGFEPLPPSYLWPSDMTGSTNSQLDGLTILGIVLLGLSGAILIVALVYWFGGKSEEHGIEHDVKD